jgi:pyruvate dehydrogenase E1 component alpha subunit
MKRDPIPNYRARLLEAGVAAATFDEVDQAIAAEVDEATEAATDGPEPGPELVHKDVWADGGWSWRN